MGLLQLSAPFLLVIARQLPLPLMGGHWLPKVMYDSNNKNSPTVAVVQPPAALWSKSFHINCVRVQ